jgi:hypothetical protein
MPKAVQFQKIRRLSNIPPDPRGQISSREAPEASWPLALSGSSAFLIGGHFAFAEEPGGGNLLARFWRGVGWLLVYGRVGQARMLAAKAIIPIAIGSFFFVAIPDLLPTTGAFMSTERYFRLIRGKRSVLILRKVTCHSVEVGVL